ncbi:hypothetical protein HPB49_026678 [Dermacentor silvarum]|nr:hypothetical protein HPB49_026678 [Dermacentor silvarum]
MFPSFEPTHWFAASYVIEQRRSRIASEFQNPSFLIENVTPVRGGGASEQGINSKVNLPIKTKGKAKGEITDGLKAKAATKKAKIVKQKPAPALPPVKPLHKESVYDFNDSDDDGLVVDENPPPQPRRSYERAAAIPATPDLPPISTFSINASMGNFAGGGGRLQQARLEPRHL